MTERLKDWYPKSPKEIRECGFPDSYVEFDKATLYYNGYCWAKGTQDSHTVKGMGTLYWKLGFWRGGGRNPDLEYKQEYFNYEIP